MKFLLSIIVLSWSFLAHAIMLPSKEKMSEELRKLEDEVHSKIVVSGGIENFKKEQWEYYCDNLYNTYLEHADSEVSIEWIVEQIGLFFWKQINNVGILNMLSLNGSLARRDEGLDGQDYFPKLFALLGMKESERKMAREMLDETFERVVSELVGNFMQER